MKNITKMVLKKNGWYEGRKVDATGWCLHFEKGGIKKINKFKEFFEEFGFLSIDIDSSEFLKDGEKVLMDEQITIPPIYTLEEQSADIGNYAYDESLENEDILDFQKIINEKLMRIGLFGKGNYNLFISESGKFYDDYGLLAENKDDLWDYLIATNYKNIILYEELAKK